MDTQQEAVVVAVIERLDEELPGAFKALWSITGGDGDPWGDNISWWFAVNDCLHAMGERTNPSYRPGARRYDLADMTMGDSYPGCELADAILEERVSVKDLHDADVLLEWADGQLRAAGLSY